MRAPDESVHEDLTSRLSPRDLIAVFGETRLAALVGASGISVQRYADGEEPIPHIVAVRLQFLASIVADLSGAYNERGILRWFERPRTLLDGHPPAALLSGAWRPEDPEPRRVREVAALLIAAPAS